MSRSRFGEPVELPWWVVPMGWPPVLVIAGAAVIGSPVWARGSAVLSSFVVIWLMVRIALRVESRNMQSVWISTVYGLWAFFVLVWVAGALAARG